MSEAGIKKEKEEIDNSFRKQKRKERLENLAEILSLVPCFFGFHSYMQTGQGFMHNSYQCGRCGKEDFDVRQF